MALQFTTSYLDDALPLFRYYKLLAERAMTQVRDEDLCAGWLGVAQCAAAGVGGVQPAGGGGQGEPAAGCLESSGGRLNLLSLMFTGRMIKGTALAVPRRQPYARRLQPPRYALWVA